MKFRRSRGAGADPDRGDPFTHNGTPRLRVARSSIVKAAWRASAGGLIALIVFGIAINILKFATPLYLLQVLDRIPASRSVETLVMLTVIALAAVVAAIALDAVRRRMVSRWGSWLELRFGPHLFRAALDRRGLAETLQLQPALTDLDRIRTFVSRSLVAWLDLYWVPLFLLGVFVIHPYLGWLSTLGITLVIILGVFQELLTRGPRQSARAASAGPREIVTSTERNLETVGALSMSSNLTEVWGERAQPRSDNRERSEGRRAAFAVVINGMRRVFYIGVVAVGVWLVLLDQLTFGGVFAARVMMSFAFRLVEKPIQGWRALQDAIPAYFSIDGRLSEAERAAALPVSVTQDDKARLVLDRVSFRYPNQRSFLLRQFSLELDPGTVLLIKGPAASGKTTLSRLLVGILKPRFGQVRLGDVSITRIPSTARDRLIGYLPQHTQLFEGTIRQNIARMNAGDFDEVIKAAQLADIHSTIVRLPQGYDTMIDTMAATMSGSEYKRIALARALYGLPRLLVLDEPTANIDLRSRRAFDAAIAHVKKNGAVIVITTHAVRPLRLARLADRVITLGGERVRVVNRVARPTASSMQKRKPNARSQKVEPVG